MRFQRIENLACLVMTATLSLTSCSRVAAKTEDAPEEGVPVRAIRAVVQDVPLEIAAVGSVEAINSVEVKSRIAGQVAQVAFTEGQNVTKGQLLFTIDREALERQAAEERALVERDAAMKEQARGIMARDAASEKQSRADANIAIQLGKLGVISGQRVNQLTTEHDTANAGLTSDEGALAAAESTLKADRARLAETQLQLNFTSVIAPISGRAGAAMVKVGSTVRDNDTILVTLMQIAPIYITFTIPEESLAEVQQLNSRGPLYVEASNPSGAHIEGRIVFIDNTIDTTTGTIRLKAVVPNENGALWPGEFVQVRLRLRMERSKTVIPDASVQEGLNGKYAWLLRSGRAIVAPVSIQRIYSPEKGSELAIVTSGIQPGDLVVTEGQLRLTAGAKVSLLSSSTPSHTQNNSAP